MACPSGSNVNAIELRGRQNVTVRGGTFREFFYAVLAKDSMNLQLDNMYITGNWKDASMSLLALKYTFLFFVFLLSIILCIFLPFGRRTFQS